MTNFLQFLSDTCTIISYYISTLNSALPTIIEQEKLISYQFITIEFPFSLNITYFNANATRTK